MFTKALYPSGKVQCRRQGPLATPTLLVKSPRAQTEACPALHLQGLAWPTHWLATKRLVGSPWPRDARDGDQRRSCFCFVASTRLESTQSRHNGVRAVRGETVWQRRSAGAMDYVEGSASAPWRSRSRRRRSQRSWHRPWCGRQSPS